MKTRNKILLIILAVLLMAASVLGYLWQTNRGPFGGEARLSGAHIRALEQERGYISLLFHVHGGASFHFHGESAHVYIAYYERGELVSHELVTGVQITPAHDLNGTMYWGVTTEEGLPHELRARVNFYSTGRPVDREDGTRLVSAGHQGAFDFSQFDFWPTAMMGPDFPSTVIELGERYVLHLWQTHNVFWADHNPFDPERLRESEHTLILYMVFR